MRVVYGTRLTRGHLLRQSDGEDDDGGPPRGLLLLVVSQLGVAVDPRVRSGLSGDDDRGELGGELGVSQRERRVGVAGVTSSRGPAPVSVAS